MATSSEFNAQIAEVESWFPATIRIENTKLCNETCSFCPYTMEEGIGREMSEETYRLALSQHSACGGEKIIFPSTLGEPLLSLNLEQWIRIAIQEYGYREIHTFTNASVLNERRATSLIASGLTGIMFTLHGLEREDFVAITGYKYYDRVVRNILGFMRLNAEAGYPIKCFLTIYSKYEKDFVQNHDFVKESIALCADVAVHSLGEAHNWGGKLSGGSEKEAVVDERPCGRLWKQIGIAFNGDVTMCCCDYSGSVKLGNIHSKTINEIFFGPDHTELRRLHLKGNSRKIDICSSCTARDIA